MVLFLVSSIIIFGYIHANPINSCGYNIEDCSGRKAKRGKKYYTGSGICSPNERYQFGVTWDGDLCMCRDNVETIWCAGIPIDNQHDSNAYMILQNDGNLVVYDILGSDKAVLWASNTAGNYRSRLRLKNKGKALIKNRLSQTIWSTDESPQYPSNSPFAMSGTPHASDTFTIYVVGDTPYTLDDFDILRSRISSLPDDAEALVHVGDIKRGQGMQCSLPNYTEVSEELDKSHAPVFIIPGDNDVNDCPDFGEAWKFWSDTFLSASQLTESKWDVSHFGEINRGTDTANFSFVYKKVLIFGVDVVGGIPHDRDEWDRRHHQSVEWIVLQITLYLDQPMVQTENMTIVIFGHGKPQESNRDFFESLYSRMQEIPLLNMERVMYVHGDAHKPLTHRKYGFRCVQVDLGSRQWLKLSITASKENPVVYTHGVFHKL